MCSMSKAVGECIEHSLSKWFQASVLESLKCLLGDESMKKKKKWHKIFLQNISGNMQIFFYSVCLFVFQENFNSKLSSKELNTSVKFWNLKKFIFHLVKASCNRNYFMPWSTNDVEIISEKENIMDIKVNASHYQSCWRCFSH